MAVAGGRPRRQSPPWILFDSVPYKNITSCIAPLFGYVMYQIKLTKLDQFQSHSTNNPMSLRNAMHRGGGCSLKASMCNVLDL